MEIKVEDKVIHDGVEKEVKEVMGDVLVLSDGIATGMNAVSQVETMKVAKDEKKEEDTYEMGSEEEKTNRVALRNAIEDLTPETSVTVVMNVMGRVDNSMRINTSVDWELFKKDIIQRALELRRIDSKVCETCGQTIPE